MHRLPEAFRSELGVDLPLPLPADCIALTGDGLLVGSQAAAGTPFLTQSDIASFLKAPPGYFLAGFWGHGINSYAFYWCVTDHRQRVFLRLPHGGVYMDPEKSRGTLLSILRSYATFWSLPAAGEVTRLIAVYSMGSSDACAQFSDGTYASLQRQKLTDPFTAILRAPRLTRESSSPPPSDQSV